MASIFNESIPTIPEFFRNKNIFVTGGSGFIGKVLIEKLLRSCPDIGNIYVLLREKRGKILQERVNDMTNIPLFDLVKKQNCDAIKKIVPVNGDICKLRLGLSDEDRNIIINQVNVIFHIAASVRFNDHLKKSILFNVRSVLEIIHLAEDLKNLAVFTHVSTAYCNSDKKIIEEKLYPAHADWRDAIRLAEEMDERILEIFTQKYIQPLTNTYTFTKALAEHLVNDVCRKKIPAIIFRPSIVGSSIKEPVPGWVDNLNGPTALWLAACTGILRIAYMDGYQVPDYVFVDNVAKSLIIAAWEKAVKRNNTSDISIYNCSTDVIIPYDTYIAIGNDVLKEVLIEKRIWATVKPGQWTTCYYYYFINVLLFHMIPAILMDSLLKLFGKNPLMVKLQRKIYIANMALFYFTTFTWKFGKQNYLGLEDKLLENDLDAFSFRSTTDIIDSEEISRVVETCILGSKKYLLKESREASKRAIIIDKSLKILDPTLKWFTYGFILYTLFWKYDIITYLLENIFNYFSKL